MPLTEKQINTNYKKKYAAVVKENKVLRALLLKILLDPANHKINKKFELRTDKSNNKKA
jgi:hypothetical protein